MANILQQFWYLWVLLAILAIYRLFRPQIKGWIGEKIIAFFLTHLPKEQYTVLNNLLFQTEKGTTQVDHVIVSVYGIFVVETKNYSGWIFGDDRSREWTQVIYRNKQKFMNPIHQNYAHIKAVESRTVAYSNLPIIGIVAFSPSCTLKTKANGNVVYFHQINHVIKKYQEKKIDEAQLPDIVRALTETNINSFVNTQKHIKEIKGNLTQEKEAISNRKCPKCNGNLIFRKGKYGNFYGCENYPKCRFTIKAENDINEVKAESSEKPTSAESDAQKNEH